MGTLIAQDTFPTSSLPSAHVRIMMMMTGGLASLSPTLKKVVPWRWQWTWASLPLNWKGYTQASVDIQPSRKKGLLCVLFKTRKVILRLLVAIISWQQLLGGQWVLVIMSMLLYRPVQISPRPKSPVFYRPVLKTPVQKRPCENARAKTPSTKNAQMPKSLKLHVVLHVKVHAAKEWNV